MVSSFDLSHGSQIKVTTQSSWLCRVLLRNMLHLLCRCCGGEQAEELVLCPPVLFA